MHKLLTTAACLIGLTAPALATDVTSTVTKIGGKYDPLMIRCTQYQTTAGGPNVWFGFSNQPANNPSVDDYREALMMSHAFKFLMTYTLGSTGSTDCPLVIETFGLSW